MARIRQQPQMGENDLLELLQLAGAARQLSQPPPMDDLLKLLGIATTLHQNEQELALKQQAQAVAEQQAATERMKAEKIDPTMFGYLSAGASPEELGRLRKKQAPDVFTGQPEAAPQEQLPQLGQPAPSKLPKGRLAMKSMKSFLGYQPPEGNVEAVLDEKGNIMNFVKAGTTEHVQDFVPSVESAGGFPASKYAVGQQLTALARYLGLAQQPQQTLPY